MNTPATIFLTDISSHFRFGLKGAAAEDWLKAKGLTPPDQPNTWVINQDVLIMRLGAGEFLIEAETEMPSLTALSHSATSDVDQLYKVPRFDAAWKIQGSDALNLLTELCMLDLHAETSDNKLCMTLVAGINAIVLRLPNQASPCYYLLCDGSYHHYMQEALRLEEVA